MDRRGGSRQLVMRKTIITISIAGFVAATIALALTMANAVPRYSARYEQSCRLCHVNPAGGGMRTAYAAQFIVPEELAFAQLSEEATENLDPQIGNNVSIGADLRTFHFYSEDETAASNFFEMQGNVYLDFHMNEQMSLYISQGMSRSYELYGMAHVLPFSGYVKVGRFMPSFGWRFADHTTYTREEMGFFPPNHTDVGIELGFAPERFVFSLGLMNGNRGNTFDNNDDVAAVLRAAYRETIANVAIGVGASAYHSADPGQVDNAGGFFGYLSWRELSWVGELDWKRSEFVGGTHRTGLVTSHEFAYLVHKGIDIKATYDFYDPDWNFLSGSRRRFGGGVAFLANPFFSIEVMGRHTNVTVGEQMIGTDYDETLLQFHFLY
jgi:hypothetical protein